MDRENLIEQDVPSLMFCDDLMFQFFGNHSMLDVCLEYSHHTNLSVVVTTQGFHMDNHKARLAIKQFR